MKALPALADPPVRRGLFKQFSTTVFDQIVLSGANFLVGLMLIRHTGDTDYGMYVLVQAAIALLISGQMAWLSSPLAVLAPAKSWADRRIMIGAIDVSMRGFLRRVALAAMLVPVAGFLLHVWSALEAAVIAGAVVASWCALQREYLRSVLLVYARPDSMLRADLISIAVLLGGVSVVVYGGKPAVLWAIAALIASALAGEAAARRSLNASPGFAAGDPKPFWHEMRPLGTWATIGALTYWVYNQSYNYVLAMRIDLTAVADVNATRLLLMPTIVLTVGIKSLLVPTASGWLAESSIRRLIERLLMFATAIAMLDLAYCAVLWVTRDWLTHDLMHKTIGNRDLLLLLWAALSLIALYRDLLQTGLFALRKFKSLAGVTAVSAVVSLTIMWLCIKSWGPAAALIGQVAGEAVNLAGVVLLLAMAHREDGRA